MVGQLDGTWIWTFVGLTLFTSSGWKGPDSRDMWWYTPDLYIEKSSKTMKETERGPPDTRA